MHNKHFKKVSLQSKVCFTYCYFTVWPSSLSLEGCLFSGEGGKFLCAHLKCDMYIQAGFCDITTNLESSRGPVNNLHNVIM